jgi:hypothetical protein
LQGALVVPEAQSLDGGQQVTSAEEATLANPQAQVEREASATAFKELDNEQAVQLAVQKYPAVMSHQEGGPPQLPAGQRVNGFDEPDAARVEMGGGTTGGDVGIIQSSVPMATESAAGVYTSVDLSLHEAGGGFEAANPLVPARIPKRLGEGAQLPDAGVSLTPVDGQGTPLDGGEGVSEGAAVDYANTQTDTDTILKFSSLGIDAGSLIRSVSSPEVFYYKVGMPAGAELSEAPNGSGGAQVVKEGAILARAAAPVVRDAAGGGGDSTLSSCAMSTWRSQMRRRRTASS